MGGRRRLQQHEQTVSCLYIYCMDVYESWIMDVELLFMERKDHWSNQSTDPEISSSPTTTMEESDIVQQLCQDAIKRRIK